MKKSSGIPMALCVGLALTVSCKGAEKPDDTATATVDTSSAGTLYARLGGKDAITAVVDSFVAIVAKDDRINKKFAQSDIGRVKAMLVEQICAQTGGPCTYTGRSMKESHANLGVTEGEFNALVSDLLVTLDSYNVAEADQDMLVSALAPMKGDIVEVNSDATGTALPPGFTPKR